MMCLLSTNLPTYVSQLAINHHAAGLVLYACVCTKYIMYCMEVPNNLVTYNIELAGPTTPLYKSSLGRDVGAFVGQGSHNIPKVITIHQENIHMYIQVCIMWISR